MSAKVDELVKQLDQKRFDALVGMMRSPATSFFSKELEWYATQDECVLGVVLIDTTDNDFIGIVLGRDEAGKYRAIDLKVSFSTFNEAKNWIFNTLKFHIGFGKKVYSQDDKSKGLDLFTPIVPLSKQHPSFIRLNRDVGFLSAKQLIAEIMPHYIDIDGNFIEQFQTDGFESRLWELYLNSYFNEEKLFINRDNHSPDFIVEKYGKKVSLEAVIVGRKKENPNFYFRLDPYPKFPSNIREETDNLMPIRFGSPLFSKLKKEYWAMPHVNGSPLIFALIDFHDDQSILWSSTALINYLYGVKHINHYDKKGNLIITPREISSHKKGEKEITSGFFFQEDVENISGVMFSSTATLSKFNRIGKQAGFGSNDVTIIRHGACHDHNPNASVPLFFQYKVDSDSNETWAEGLSIYHNPNALHSIPRELFSQAAHHYFENGQVVSYLPDFFPYNSLTHIIVKSTNQ